MHRLLTIVSIFLGLMLTMASTAAAQGVTPCQVSDETVAAIRQMLTAPDNGIFFDIWTREEIACACIELYYDDPQDAPFHDRVIAGAIVLLGKTEDPRAVAVLIDAIDSHGPQALYALGNFPTVEALNALVANVRNDDPESRENAAEGLRHMPAPPDNAIPDGWVDALKAAIDEVGDWMMIEPEPTFKDYFLDAHYNLTQLLAQAQSATAPN